MAEYIKKDELLAELWKKYCAGCDFRRAGFSHLCLGFSVCECSKCGISEAFDVIDECQAVYKEPQPDETARKISEILPQDEILAQIAEEHAEAALKGGQSVAAMAKYENLFRCRLCGKLLTSSGTDSQRAAEHSTMNAVLEASGLSPLWKNENVLTMYEMHACEDGSFGVADFLGTKKMPEEREEHT